MKKLNYLLLGLAGLAMASCSQEDLVGPAQGDGNFNVTVQLPADLATRAVDMNTGYTAENLNYAVYDADGNFITQGSTTFGNSLQTVVSFNLATGKSYQISFFAQAEGSEDVYVFDGKKGTMVVHYDEMTSEGTEQNDIYDCFINLLETGQIGSSTVNASITLYRPIAQINWGTDDLDEPAIEAEFGKNGEYLESTLTLSTGAYNTFSLLDNDVVVDSSREDLLPDGQKTAGVDVQLEKFTQPINANEQVALFPVEGYEYVTMQYLLAPKNGTTYDLNLAISNSANPNVSEVLTDNVVVSSAPVQANYRTNIYGSLLTDNVNITVDKDPNWGGNYNLGYVYTSDNLVSAIESGGNIKIMKDVSTPNNLVITKDTEIDLNENTLTITSGYLSKISNESNVTFKNGKLNFTGQSGAKYDLSLSEGSALTLDGVILTTTAAGINAQADHAGLTITKSTLTGPYYLISSNASGTTEEDGGDYGKDGSIILEGSTFVSTGGTPLMNNVPETITATNCTFNGKIQCAFIRGGNLTMDNCTLNLTHSMEGNPYRLKTWLTGNTACIGGLVGGNYDTTQYADGKEPSYNYPTIITLAGNTSINIYGDYAAETPGIHLASAGKNVVTFNYVPEDVSVTYYAAGTAPAEGYYKIEFATLNITVNGSEITTQTPGYVGTNN